MPKKQPASNPKSITPTLAENTVVVSPRGATRIKAGHPWVYRSDIASADGVPPGAMVRVADHRGQFLGTALYSSSSQIAIRMIAGPDAEVPDLPTLIAKRIRAAIAYRKPIVSDTDAYRLVFSEADFLPGLIIDHYNDVVSVQILTQAMDTESVRGAIVATLVEEFRPRRNRRARRSPHSRPGTIAAPRVRPALGKKKFDYHRHERHRYNGPREPEAGSRGPFGPVPL